MQTNRAALIHRYGGNDLVRLEEVPPPTAGPGEMVVAVHAASVNPVDFKIREGKTKVLLPYRFPLILGNDLSGEVVSVGPGVTRFRPGDAIFTRLDKDRIGAFTDLALVRESAAAKKPDNLSHEEAASIPLVGLTAWQALRDLGGLQAGQKVLIHAGPGGVGTFAIQLARHLGATVATTASARNTELVQRLGADVIIDYKTTPFETVVRDYDMVFDTQGGDTLLRSFQVVRRGGVIVSVGGNPDGKFARAWGLNPLLVAILGLMSFRVTRAARRGGVRYEYLFMRASGEQLGEIGALLSQGIIKPVIDRVFPFDEVREALAYVEAGKAVGKVVVKIR